MPNCLRVSWRSRRRTTKTKRIDSDLQPRYNYTYDVLAVCLVSCLQTSESKFISGTNFDRGDLFDTESTIDFVSYGIYLEIELFLNVKPSIKLKHSYAHKLTSRSVHLLWDIITLKWWPKYHGKARADLQAQGSVCRRGRGRG